jgi:hypothetical protein
MYQQKHVNNMAETEQKFFGSGSLVMTTLSVVTVQIKNTRTHPYGRARVF